MNLSSNFFLKPRFFWSFRELNVRKFKKFSPDHFYDENSQFNYKKTDFRPGMEISSETTIPGISSETTETRESRVRRRKPGAAEEDEGKKKCPFAKHHDFLVFSVFLNGCAF